MKIVSLDTFLALPSGTIYSGIADGWAISGLFRKEESIDADFFYVSIIAECANGDPPPAIDGVQTRWGEFDFNAQFVVYEKQDIETIQRLLL